MTPDMVNVLFELVGGLMLWGNVVRLYRDKMVRGVHWTYMSFFAIWGWWNLYYYPYLDQWWSFAGGVSLVVANSVWIAQLFYYNWREHNG